MTEMYLLTLYHTSSTFNDPEKENFEMLVTSIFLLFHNVFYSFQIKFQCLINIHFVDCKCFQFGPVLNSVVW